MSVPGIRVIHEPRQERHHQGPPEPDVSLLPSGERDMIAAVVLKAVKDLSGKGKGTSRQTRQEAQAWIFGDRTSFAEMVSWLGWDADAIRQKLWAQEQARWRELLMSEMRENPYLASQQEWADAYFALNDKALHFAVEIIEIARNCDCGCEDLKQAGHIAAIFGHTITEGIDHA